MQPLAGLDPQVGTQVTDVSIGNRSQKQRGPLALHTVRPCGKLRLRLHHGEPVHERKAVAGDTDIGPAIGAGGGGAEVEVNTYDVNNQVGRHGPINEKTRSRVRQVKRDKIVAFGFKLVGAGAYRHRINLPATVAPG